MNIVAIDADLIGRKNHRFPNLCCMKISGYHKRQGDRVTLKTNYDGLNDFDKVYVAKVFTDTPIPTGGMFDDPLDAPNVIKGGTGFFYDKAEPLPPQIEHSMPDYHLYDGVCNHSTYTDYSIGYLTRGCFRHCSFCVNRRSNKVVAHSPLEEFFDRSRKKICLLDDNFFGYDGWRELLIELRNTGKPFVFKQGLDVRLLTEEKAQLLFTSNYDGDYIFAFDDPELAPLIENRLRLIRRHTQRRVKFYILCGFDRRGVYDEFFWQRDLQSVFDRAELLKKYDCLPYVMRHKNYLQSPNPRDYTQVARWCNQPHLFLKTTFDEFLAKDADYKSQRRRHEQNNSFRQFDT